jgi:hypothetical protein
MSVGRFAPIVQPFVLAVFDPGCDLRLGRAVGSQLIRHEDTRLAPTFHEFAQETLGGDLVTARLNH